LAGLGAEHLQGSVEEKGTVTERVRTETAEQPTQTQSNITRHLLALDKADTLDEIIAGSG
jgi:hypothetical protein